MQVFIALHFYGRLYTVNLQFSELVKVGECSSFSSEDASTIASEPFFIYIYLLKKRTIANRH